MNAGRLLLLAICPLVLACPHVAQQTPDPSVATAPGLDTTKTITPAPAQIDASPATVSNRALSLTALLAYADAHAPVLRSAHARVGVAEAAGVDADLRIPQNPELSMAAGARLSDRRVGFQFEVAIEQQLEIAGQARHRVASAHAQREHAMAIVDELRWTVHVEVHRLFDHLLLLDERLERVERFVQFSQGLRDAVARRIEAGESAPISLLVADADLAESKRARLEILQARDQTRTRLAAVIGWPQYAVPGVLGQLPEVRRAPDLQKLLDLMATHHPALATREAAIATRRAQVAVERSNAIPNPTVGAAYEREPGLGGESSAHLWTLQASIPVPLWRQNRQAVARARAQLELARQEREASSIQLRAELTQAVQALNGAVEQVEVFSSSVVPNLAEKLRLLERAHELGEVDLNTVSQTRQRLLEAGQRYTAARIMYFKSAAILEELVGTAIWHGEHLK